MSPALKVAIEGCGHGTLHAIYASVEESCRIKGWDGVDLLIIGGDFQAVRNKYDLHVTAMPERFRQMADFQEYYSGVRMAPCLTIFVGGNHEASNYLFELYYGGWVAPNIYYMGAANILTLGSLRIAGLSGIWKGYDYRKPHFERLPYNKEETSSIYHVRELDVRKLLALRTQVDIGISHDWPQGVEWLGNHQWLFRRKDLFKADAEAGKLGSIAARKCLERLRPRHWFSAHLHIKYPAVVKHPEYQNMSATGHQNIKTPAIREQDRQQISAWGDFHAQAQKTDADDKGRALREQQNKKEEEASGVRSGPRYTFNETFKQVKTDDNLSRAVTAVTKTDRPQGQEGPIMAQLDGCMESKPGSLKRRRDTRNTDALNEDMNGNGGQPGPADETSRHSTSQNNGTVASSTVVAISPDKNPDAIDLDMSSDEGSVKAILTVNRSMPSNLDGTSATTVALTARPTENPDAIDLDLSDDEPVDCMEQSSVIDIQAPKTQDGAHYLGQHQPDISMSSDPDQDGGMSVNLAESSFRPYASMASILQDEPQNSHSRTTSHHSMEDLDLTHASKHLIEDDSNDQDTITDEMRAKLAELNPSFAKQDLFETSAALPFPDGITNTMTQFLALDKCEHNREFLQLLEIEPTSKQSSQTIGQRPLKLQYDPEWLAIIRVFAPELAVGGDPSDRVPKHKGDTYYRDRIMQEKDYVQKHVIDAGLLEVPENFTITAPIFNPDLYVRPQNMPREVTNPQTSAFCCMLGIDNPFDITEEARDARIAQGPRPEQPRHGGGGGRGRGRGGFNNRGGRGGNRGGRGGRGRGRW